MPHINYNIQSTIDDKDFILSTDETSNEEEDDDLSSAFISKIDKDWKPLHPEKLSSIKNTRPVRKVVTKKMNVTISLSSEEEED